MDPETKLEATISRFKQLQKIANIGNWELDFYSGVAIWSEITCHIYGIPADNIIHTYEEWESFIHPSDIGYVKGVVASSKKTFSNYNFHHRIIRPDGSVKHIYTQVEYLFDAGGNPSGLYGVAHDITDIINLKNGLIKSETNIRLIMDLIPLSIYARDPEGYYIFGNHVFLNHYGISAEELNNKHLRDFVRSPQEYAELTSQDQQVLSSNEKLFVSEFKQTDHAGDVKAWRIIKVPFTPEGHNKKAILGIAEDITSRKKQEEDLINLTNSLSKRNKDLEQFSHMVSHDLRGPLATLMGISEVVENIKLEQEDISFFIHGIKESLIKLDKIVRVLNDITSLSS
jgi:PAS domain S-box-containing protein